MVTARPVPGLVVAGVAVQGIRHLAAGQGCQDAFRASATADGDAVVLAVADGAGSRERSALGAELAVDTACRLLSEGLPGPADGPEAWTAWISERGRAVVDACQLAAEALLGQEAGPTGPPDPAVLSTALAAAVVRPPWAAFLSVGDCTATVLTRTPADDERCHLVLPPPRPGAPPPAFLFTAGARLRARTFALWDTELTGVVLATDGCTPIVLDHPSVRGLPPAAGPLPAPGFFCSMAGLLRAGDGDAEPLRALLCGPEAARSGDDLTVLCALTEGGPA